MSPFDKLFQAQVDKLLSANNKRRAFFFRGFLPKQIEFLIKHKASLYMNEDFIEDDCLQIQKIEANKRALVKQLALAEDSVVGFYEELVAISSAVKDVSLVFDGEIVIIDNPLFESNVPSPLSLEQAVALFEYMQTDGKAENDTLEVLNRYYHEVNFLDAEHVLVALANVHEDAHYLRLPLFDNKDLTEMAMINQPADEILEGSSEDWLYRFSVMSGAANEIVYVVDSVCPHNLEKGLFTVLAALSIPHSIRRVDTRIPEMEYDDGLRTVFLNTKGDGAGVPEELAALLRFMEDTREVNAVNDVLRELLEMVRVVKEDGKVTVAYMKSFEIEQMWINKGIEQGISQGISQGIEQGRSEERVNTLREKARADRLERELRKLRRGR